MKYKHIVIPAFGGPENLLLAEDELLEPQANDVRVKVLAAGVSFADILMRKGGSSGILGSWKNTIYSNNNSTEKPLCPPKKLI